MSRPTLLFYCSSLAMGRDGVGDYTRALAAQCTQAGIDCLLVALHDKHLDSHLPVVDQVTGILRLPCSFGWDRKASAVQNFLGGRVPTATSWQFVSYGFDPKGVAPARLAAFAAAHSPGIRHVMLHELWIGVHQHASMKERLMGWMQKRALRGFLRALRPGVIHTSNTPYRSLISDLGFQSKRLPLFGNIPIIAPDKSPEQRTTGGTPPAPLSILLFGTLHPQWEPAGFIQWLRALSQRLGCPTTTIMAGRTGAHAAAVKRSFEEAGLDIKDMGELPPEHISQLMQECTFGVAVHPFALIAKSGVVAAMLDHGLPVLVPRDDWRLRGGPAKEPPAEAEPLILRLGDATPANTDAWLSARRAPQASLPSVSDKFLTELSLLRQP